MLRLREAGVIALTLVCGVTSAGLTFPEDFLLGAGSSAYQTEGAWNVDGKSESNWDHKTHTDPLYIRRNASADDACESYYKYEEDVRMMKDLGLDAYRFSVSWSRVLPDGVSNRINWIGLQFYKNLTQKLIDNNIKPIVTIYHWDHPYVLEEKGGWLNDKMVDWLVDYARIVIKELGPMVPIFITINEITDYCQMVYDDVSDTDSKTRTMSSEYNLPDKLRCIHNMVKAHAKVYHMYDKEFRPMQRGQIGLVTACRDLVPQNASDPSDVAFAEIAWDFDCGIATHPIWIGDWPESVKTRIAKASKARGYSTSALPEFSPHWVDYIRGTSDFFGINFYISGVVFPDHGTDFESGMLAVIANDSRTHAIGLRRTLIHIKNNYRNPPIIITENGVSTSRGLYDPERIELFDLMLRETLKSIRIDGTNVKGYLIWSLLDSFEWDAFYVHKYGIIDVDFASPDRTRTPKLSAKWLKKVLETRDLDIVDTYYFMARNSTIVENSSTRSSSCASSPETSWMSSMFTLAITYAVIFGNTPPRE